MIKINNLSKSFDGGKTYSVKELDLEVKKGELLVLLGSSGCGKSTTMKMINRLIEPTQGTIEIDGTDGADTLVGSIYTDIIAGGLGDDIIALSGHDIVKGQNNNDTFTLAFGGQFKSRAGAGAGCGVHPAGQQWPRAAAHRPAAAAGARRPLRAA